MPEEELRLKPFTPAQERVGNLVIRVMSALNVLVFRLEGQARRPVSGGRAGSPAHHHRPQVRRAAHRPRAVSRGG